MTAAQAYNFASSGGANDFAEVIAICEKSGPYCLIGGLALNSYIDPVYTLDADLVVAGSSLEELTQKLLKAGFEVEDFPYTLNAIKPMSDLRIQFTKMPEYAHFPSRAVIKSVFGIQVKVSSIEDLLAGKILAFSDPTRRLSKRKKDELDLIRIGESYPHLISLMPNVIQDQF